MPASFAASKTERILFRISAAVLGVIAAVSIAGFFHSDTETRAAMQNERIGYVTEITGQLTRSVQNSRDSFMRELRSAAGSVNYLAPQSLSDLESVLGSSDAYLLLAEDGSLVSQAGGAAVLGDYSFPGQIYADGEAAAFSTVNRQDCWLFGTQINPLAIDGVTYTALILKIPSDTFRDSLTVSLFNGVGAAYVIRSDGAVSVRANSETLAFNGYNLFSSIQSAGAPAGDVAALKNAVAAGEDGSLTTSVDGVQWMISYHNTGESDSWIVVTVPLSVTAADTFSSMSVTIFCAFALVVSLAALVILIAYRSGRINRRREAQAAAVAAQSGFLSKMSHDIRTPLNAVTGLLTLAEDPSKTPEEVRGYIRQSRESADYLLELINDILDLQKINSGKMEISAVPFSLETLIGDTAAMYAPAFAAKGLAFRQQSSGGEYLGDPVKIKRILINLLSNAMKFTPEGGTVTLGASRAAGEGECDLVSLSVADTGTGISDEFKKKLFLPFEQEQSSYTSPYAGTGLGLSIVKKLCDLMGGTVSVSSEQGRGSVFTVTLPLARTTEAAQPSSEEVVAPFRGEKILLAEDNLLNREIATALLTEQLNLTVVPAENGRDAVNRIAASAPGEYAAVLMDIRMPVMDGLAAARAIRALSRPDAKTLPIIALSANTFSEDVELSLAAGMNAHLGKPMDIAAVARELHQLIKGD